MSRNYSNTAVQTTLDAGITSAATTLSVASTTGFPAVDFILALDAEQATQELVLVTNVAGTTLTVERGYDNTTAVAHDAGAVVRHSHAAIDFTNSRDHEAATEAHGATGAVVGTTNTQALTNKDLSSGTNTFPAALATDAEVTSAIDTHAADTSTHGVGEIVGRTEAQVLTNKTIGVTNTVAGVVPIGCWLPYGGAAAPDANWLICDGSAVSRATYSDLFAVLGAIWGDGDGVTTFNLPDLRDKTTVGASGTKVRGEYGGVDVVGLTTANIPAHTHTIDHGHNIRRSDTTTGASTVVAASGVTADEDAQASAWIVDHTGNSGSTGSGDDFNVQNPYTAANYIIRAL